MPERLLRRLIDHLRAIGPAAGDLPTDGELLDRYLLSRDEAAFELLVRRHGALVLGICRRTLHDTHAAEDAFQATFLVLARKARSVRQPTVAGWLYRVAQRVALRARQGAARRAIREQPLVNEPAFEEPDRLAGQDLRAVLDDELGRLPERLRLPVLLCYVEGHTTEQAARLLGCPRGTVLSRLATARKRLRVRLLRRGVGLPAAGLAVELAETAWSATVPTALAVRAAFSFSTGKAGPAGAASAQAVHLAEGVLHAMFVTKLRFALGTVLVLGALTAAMGRVVFDAPAQGQDRLPAVAAKGPGQPPADPQNEAKTLLERARKELDVRQKQLDTVEEERSRALIDARMRLLELEEELRALERDHETDLAEYRRKLEQDDPAREAEVAQLRKQISDFVAGIAKESLMETPRDKVLNWYHMQLDSSKKSIQEKLARAEEQRHEMKRRVAGKEQLFSRGRLELRKRILGAEERVRLLERRTARETDRAQVAIDAAAARVRQLEGLPASPPGPANRSSAAVDRRLDELLREIAELRKELKRQREGK